MFERACHSSPDLLAKRIVLFKSEFFAFSREVGNVQTCNMAMGRIPSRFFKLEVATPPWVLVVAQPHIPLVFLRLGGGQTPQAEAI